MLDSLLDNPIFFLSISYTVGLLLDWLLRCSSFYQRFTQLRLFSDQRTYERCGVVAFGRLVVRLRLTMNAVLRKGIPNRELDTLRRVRDQMLAAEIGHWMAAAFMLLVTILAIWRRRSTLVIVGYVLLNVIGNVYLSLFQQYNKYRLDRVIASAEKKFAG